MRLSASSGSLKPYITDTPLSTEDLLDEKEGDAEVIGTGKAVWFDDIGEYLFSDVL